jgi:hypothetical protein
LYHVWSAFSLQTGQSASQGLNFLSQGLDQAFHGHKAVIQLTGFGVPLPP